MPKDTYYKLVVSINEDVAAVSLIYLHADNNDEYEKQYIAANIYFEAIVTSIKNKLFHHSMVDFVNKIKLIDHTYQTNGTVRDEYYKEKLLFPMIYFVSIGAYFQSIFYVNKVIKI